MRALERLHILVLCLVNLTIVFAILAFWGFVLYALVHS